MRELYDHFYPTTRHNLGSQDVKNIDRLVLFQEILLFKLSRPFSPDHFYIEQEVHGPHRSPEKTVQSINT